MEFETLADVYDAFERDNMGYETVTDMIKGENIKIAEINMDPIGDFEKILGRKDGGMMIAIEQLGKGGITGGKTYHQYHDQFVPPDSESQMYANGGGVGSMMQPKKKSYKDQKLTAAEKKKIKPANQGGGPNYLGKQETVTVPKKWLSDPDHVVAELAYITPREQKILLDENLYGSLKGKPNKGPGGVMSLQGDLGGYSASTGGKSGDSSGKGGGGSSSYKDTDYYKMMTGQKNIGQTVKTGPKTRKYAVPEYVNVKQPDGSYKNTYVGSGYKSYGQPSFLGGLFSRGARGYRGIKGMPAFGNTQKNLQMRDGPLGMGYYSDKENFAETRDAVPFGIMGIISNILDKFKKPPVDYSDMSEFNKLGLGGVNPAALDFDPNAKINQTIDTTGIDNSLALSKFYSPNAFNKKPKANVNVNNDMQTYMDDQTNFMGPVTGVNYPGGAPNEMQEFLSDEQNYVGPVTGVNYPGGAPNVMQEYMDDQINTGNMIDNRYVTEEQGLVGDGSYGLQLGTPFNNPVGGLDQYAKEMEALESMVSPPLSEDGLPGLSYNIPVSAMGGTVQDFYTNRNLTGAATGGKPTDANTIMQVYNDGINFNDQVSLPGNNMVAEITDKDRQMMETPVGQMMDYDTFKTISGNDTLTEQEFNQLKTQVG